MLAARMPSILPLLSPAEALETSMIQSLAGLLREGGISRQGPFCDPHHMASNRQSLEADAAQNLAKSLWPITACYS
jgi:predicted ATPase with chaperone activity